MEISPIAGIRVMSVVKIPPADSDLSRVFDVENSSRPDEDTYTGSGKKAAGGQDDEDDDDELVEEGAENVPVRRAVEHVRGAQIDYFV
ncbi:MAG TPA: hypothetical protein VMW15_16930 [Terracidiphilus sp.]|jgi:hypothetical protein|nr:hypothetical protein [Terracidiphilus sp.]